MKLTPAQQRALDKLSESEGQCAYELGESLVTLRALCKKGVAWSHTSGLGSCFSPRTATNFYRKQVE